jgi:hypothetical protein
MTRSCLRSLLLLLLLAEAGMWIAITIAQLLATMSVIKSETADALWPVFAILALAFIAAALGLIVSGVIGLAGRLWRLRVGSRNSSLGSGCTRPDR